MPQAGKYPLNQGVVGDADGGGFASGKSLRKPIYELRICLILARKTTSAMDGNGEAAANLDIMY
jgi:hypothetical protein